MKQLILASVLIDKQVVLLGNDPSYALHLYIF